MHPETLQKFKGPAANNITELAQNSNKEIWFNKHDYKKQEKRTKHIFQT